MPKSASRPRLTVQDEQAGAKRNIPYYTEKPEPDEAQCALAWYTGAFSDRERQLGVEILLDALLGTNQAPLKAALLEEKLGADIDVGFDDSTLQPTLELVLRGATEESAGKFAELTQPYDGFHNMVFTEESTVGAFLLRARREGLRDFGACMSPHTAWLILQGIETLPLRMAQHMRNTEKVVEFLAAQPFVSRVGHPLLESHPSHALAQKLLPRGAGSVFSFDLKGNREQGKKFIETLKVFSHLANVGDCRSLVIHPASTTHFRMGDEALAGAGISQGTIRLSIGLEDADDLIDDLKRALKAAEKAGA
jgi:hypothetical protein